MRIDLEQFDRAYRSDTDPWRFASSAYEQRKYDVTVACLPRRRYRRCFEPGCSIGALTSRLAERADKVVAIDTSPTAIRSATKKLTALANVSIEQGALPEDWPSGAFDLIVFSEIGYYWDESELATIVGQARERLTADGQLIGVHWLGYSDDHLLGGMAVHHVITRIFGKPIVHHREPAFVLDVWDRP